MGFTYASATPSVCAEANAVSTSAYNSRTPNCLFTTDTDDNVLLTVTNLNTAIDTTLYGLEVFGLKNGPSARTSMLNGDSSTGTQGIFYEGVVETGDSPFANDYSFFYVSKSSGVTLTADPAMCGAEGELTISFTVAEPIVADGGFMIAFPY